MSEERKWLTESLQRHLLPLLVQRGFKMAQPDALHPPIGRKFARAFPLGRLVRTRASGTDQISIQFANDDRSVFRINACIVPPKEIITARNKLPEVQGFLAKGLSEHFEMYASPRLWAWFTWGWFSVRQWPFRSLVHDDYEKLALRVASYEPELELALREGKLGPHMRRVLLPYYVPNTKARES